MFSIFQSWRTITLCQNENSVVIKSLFALFQASCDDDLYFLRHELYLREGLGRCQIISGEASQSWQRCWDANRTDNVTQQASRGHETGMESHDVSVSYIGMLSFWLKILQQWNSYKFTSMIILTRHHFLFISHPPCCNADWGQSVV